MRQRTMIEGAGPVREIWRLAERGLVRCAQLTRLRYDVDDGWPASLNDPDGPVKRWADLIHLHNRAEAFAEVQHRYPSAPGVEDRQGIEIVLPLRVHLSRDTSQTAWITSYH